MGAYAGRDLSESPVLTLLDLKLPKVAGPDRGAFAKTGAPGDCA